MHVGNLLFCHGEFRIDCQVNVRIVKQVPNTLKLGHDVDATRLNIENAGDAIGIG